MGNRRRNINIYIKVLTPIISILAFLGGIWEFKCNQEALKELEYRKIIQIDSLNTEQRMIEKKMQIYSKIGESVGSILASDRSDFLFKKYINNFEKIYYGEAIIVEDLSVNKTMKIFKLSVSDYMNDYVSKVQLNQRGMALCDTLRVAILKTKTVYNYK